MTDTAEAKPEIYYLHPGYSMVDHQLDPLLDVARQWIFDMYDPNPSPERTKQTADRIAGALEAAAAHVRNMGTPAEPLDIDCDVCGAPPRSMCWNPHTYTDNTRPHKARCDAARGLYKIDVLDA